MSKLLALAFAALLALVLAAGCTPAPDAQAEADGTANGAMTDHDDATEDADEPGDSDAKEDEEPGDTKVTGSDGGMTLAVYRNAEGQLACPVMNSPIESEEKAFSHTDYNGKRYYFCCNGCPEVFEKNKDKYAK
jgi:YHS domain-containing protein